MRTNSTANEFKILEIIYNLAMISLDFMSYCYNNKVFRTSF